MSSIDTQACRRLKSAIATESGNIMGMAEKFIANDNGYALNRVKPTAFDASQGVDPVSVRYSTAPVQDAAYGDLLVSGEQDGTMSTVDCAGNPADLAANYNQRGAYGCNIPAVKINGGYDTFTRVMKGRAWETDIVCAMDLLLRKHSGAFVRMLRNDLPKRAKEQFQFDLERNIIAGSYYNTSVTGAFTHARGEFPVAPSGTLDIGTILRLRSVVMAQGWVGPFEVEVSYQAFETMRLNYKKNTGQELNTTVVGNDSHFLGRDRDVLEFGGVRFVLTDKPIRGYLETQVDGSQKFVRVLPTKARLGTGQGIVTDVNEDFFNCFTYCNGVRRELYEVGLYIHPMAANRQALSVAPIADKRFDNVRFNFEARMIDGAYLDCNEDEWKFKYRLLHAYAFESLNPELMGGIIYRVQPELIYLNTPVCDSDCLTDGEPVEMKEAPAPPSGDCDQCACDEGESLPYEPLDPMPSEDDPCPEDTTGVVSLSDCGPLLVKQGGSLFIGIRRIGGTNGAASVEIDTTNGTATSGDDYTALSSELIEWADGEGGVKYAEVPIAADGSGTFTYTLSTVVGATLANGTTTGCITATAEIIECETTTTTTGD